jgi:hypothetical protein
MTHRIIQDLWMTLRRSNDRPRVVRILNQIRTRNCRSVAAGGELWLELVGSVLDTNLLTELTKHLAWPMVALIALIVIRPYISQVSRAAADMKSLLDRSGEMVDLVGQIAALNESTSDLKAMAEVARAARPDPPVTPAIQANTDLFWTQLEREWKEVREAFRIAAQNAGVPVNFFGNIGVRNAAKSLVEKGIIKDDIASAITDLSSQYQYMTRTSADRSDYLNENVVSAYSKTSARVRQALLAAR